MQKKVWGTARGRRPGEGKHQKEDFKRKKSFKKKGDEKEENKTLKRN